MLKILLLISELYPHALLDSKIRIILHGTNSKTFPRVLRIFPVKEVGGSLLLSTVQYVVSLFSLAAAGWAQGNIPSPPFSLVHS